MTEKIKITPFRNEEDKLPNQVPPENVKNWLRKQVAEGASTKKTEVVSSDIKKVDEIKKARNEVENTYHTNKEEVAEASETLVEPKEEQKNKSLFRKVLGFLNRKKKTIALTGIATGMSIASMASNKTAEGVFSDTANSKSINFTDSTSGKLENMLKEGEKYKEIPINKEVAGIKIESMILIPMPSDTTRDYYLVKFSGEGDNIIGKELAALKSINLEPGYSAFLGKINDEAFRKVGKSVKAIDDVYEEAENLGQNEYVLVNKNKTVKIRNSIREQTTEVGAMAEYGTTTDYATLASKKRNTVTLEQDFVKNK